MALAAGAGAVALRDGCVDIDADRDEGVRSGVGGSLANGLWI